jgi:hypothetical protein
MTAPAVAPASAEAEESRRAAEAAERLSRFRTALHVEADRLLPPGPPRPLPSRRQEEYNRRQDEAADVLLDQAQAELEAIEDVAERCLAAEALVKAIDAYCDDDARYWRDIGLIVMLFKHYDGWRQYLLAKRAIDEALNRGEIDEDEHRVRRGDRGHPPRRAQRCPVAPDLGRCARADQSRAHQLADQAAHPRVAR